MSLSFRLSTRRFGELLMERGRVTPEQLALALRSHQDPRERLGQTLVRLGLLKERDVTELLGEQFSLTVVDAEQLAKADPEAVELVPEHLARQSLLLALRREGDTLDVAVGDPLDVVARLPEGADGLHAARLPGPPERGARGDRQLLPADPQHGEPGRDPRQARSLGDGRGGGR
jgi:hypothetical protein